MEIIQTDNAPAAIGPYSQAVVSNGFVFCSGQISLDTNGELITGSIQKETEQIMENLIAVLQAAGTDLSKVVKTTVYLTNINDFAEFNELYGNYFDGENKPARATVEVSNLPKGVKVEIDCIAEL
jgi:2-iminobutanoate/2-iminopropanoate deaminase